MISLEPPAGFSSRFDVVSCFIEHDAKILLLLRQDHKPQPNTWGMPAGKVETGESLEEAILREIEEEVGIRVSPLKLIYLRKLYVRYPGYDYVYHIYRHTVKRMPRITMDQQAHKEYRWVDPEGALKLDLIEDEDVCIKLVYDKAFSL